MILAMRQFNHFIPCKPAAIIRQDVTTLIAKLVNGNAKPVHRNGHDLGF